MKKTGFANKGFTLVELLVVMAIMGILAVITLSNFSTSQAKGRDAQRKSDLKQIGIALEAYYADHGEYPVSGASTNAGKIMACDDSSGNCTTASYPTACNWGGAISRQFCDKSNTVYMKEIPNDSVSSRQYYYISDKKSWQLYAVLENTKDLDKLTTPKTFNSVIYTFGIASSNAKP